VDFLNVGAMPFTARADKVGGSNRRQIPVSRCHGQTSGL